MRSNDPLVPVIFRQAKGPGDLSHTQLSRATFSLTEGDLIIGKQNQTAIGTLVEGQLSLTESMATAAPAAVDHRVTTVTLQSITARIRFLTGQLKDIDPELALLIAAHPALPSLGGSWRVGTKT